MGVKKDSCFELKIKTLKDGGLFDRGQLYIMPGDGLAISVTKVGEAVSLKYTYNGQAYCYNIPLSFKASNLGNGERVYFVCPINGNRYTALYMGADGGIFRSREAFSSPLLYPLQSCSRAQRDFIRRGLIDNRIAEMTGNRIDIFHKGNITRRYQKVINLAGIRQDIEVRLLGKATNYIEQALAAKVLNI